MGHLDDEFIVILDIGQILSDDDLAIVESVTELPGVV